MFILLILLCLVIVGVQLSLVFRPSYVPTIYGRTIGRLVVRARAVRRQLEQLRTRLLAQYQAADGYLKFFSLTLLVAVLIFLVLPPLLRLFYPTAGSFDSGTINTLALAALQYFAATHLALFTYRRLFPTLYDYLVESLQDKVLESVTKELETQLAHPELLRDQSLLPVLSEQRQLLALKFSIRCKRLLFCLLPLAFLYIGAHYTLASVLTVVPH
jgi:hypothetical protein